MTNANEPTTNAGQILAELRKAREEKDAIAAQEKLVNERIQRLTGRLLAFHEQTGLERVAGAGLSVTFDPHAVRTKYDPERWPAIVKWAIETGNDHIVQRRLSDGKVADLVAEGVALPEGLTLEPYVNVSIRKAG